MNHLSRLQDNSLSILYYQQADDEVFRVRSESGFKLKLSVWAQGQIMLGFIFRDINLMSSSHKVSTKNDIHLE